MSRIGNNIFSLLEGVECDPSKVIENAILIHKASPAPAPPKKGKITQKEISKNEAALDLQQHLLYSSQNRFRNLRRGRQGNYSYNRGYCNGCVSSNGRQQENREGSQEKDGELNNNNVAADINGSEKAPAIDVAADIVDAKSEIGRYTADNTSEVAQGDGTGSEESTEK